MHSRNASQNPVFQKLAEIQRYTDVCPNPEDSNFETCRAKRVDGGRCRNPPCRQEERWHTPSLLSEFRNMTECPNTESFHDRMRTFVTYTHCKRWHRVKVLDAFDQWESQRIADRTTSRQRPAPVSWQNVSSTLNSRPIASVQSMGTSNVQPITAAALQFLPSTPSTFVPSSASATSDDGSSSVDSITESRSVSSNTTFMSSLPNTPLRNGTTARYIIEDITEEDPAAEDIPSGDVVAKDTIDAGIAMVEDNVDEDFVIVQVDLEQEVIEEVAIEEEPTPEIIIVSEIKQDHDDKRPEDLLFETDIHTTQYGGESSGERQDTAIKGLGITGLQRSGSIRDHSPVFQVICSHPTPEKMKEGVVYILEHEENPSLFKIGWSRKSAQERLNQPNNCYGINTRIIYETKRFAGAAQAERIAQVVLRHVNIRVLECFKCQGGHREWFLAPRETVRETVMQVEGFLQMPAYTLQDREYKLSPEAYNRVVKQMCDFSVVRLGELMRGPKETEEGTETAEAETTPEILLDTILTPLAQLTDEPAEISRPNTSNGLSEIQEVNKSFVSTSTQDTKPQQLSAGVKLARKVKRLLSVGDSVKTYFLRSRGQKLELDDDDKRPFGSVFVDLKGKAR
ncbi:hypothetical protein V8C35DRAFT_297868 [Trichoderma chlorosporum]